MYTTRIQNMSIEELVEEAHSAENEVALKIFERMGGFGYLNQEIDAEDDE